MKVDELECNEVWVNVGLMSIESGWTWVEWGVTLVNESERTWVESSECECKSSGMMWS